MPIVNEKIKCSRCEKLIQKKVILANDGKCVNCGYLIAKPLLNFANVNKAIQR